MLAQLASSSPVKSPRVNAFCGRASFVGRNGPSCDRENPFQLIRRGTNSFSAERNGRGTIIVVQEFKCLDVEGRGSRGKAGEPAERLRRGYGDGVLHEPRSARYNCKRHYALRVLRNPTTLREVLPFRPRD